MAKVGKPSVEELAFIEANIDTYTVEQIAERLNRTVDFVAKHKAQCPQRQKMSEAGEHIQRLRISPLYSELKQCLSAPEIARFEQQWAALLSQFVQTGDVLETDHMMVKDLIILDIMGSRVLATYLELSLRIQELREKIEKENLLPEDTRDKVAIQIWNTEIQSLVATVPSLTRDHRDYQHRKDAKLEGLNATRNQRFKRIEERAKNPIELFKDLDSVQRRIREGRAAEKMKIAANKLRDEWQQHIEYEDGTFDSPLLTPEGELKNAKRAKEARLSDEQKDAETT